MIHPFDVPARSTSRGRAAKTVGGKTRRCRRLARGEPDLALRQGKPRHRVHQEQHPLPLVAEILGDGGGDCCAALSRSIADLSEVASTDQDRVCQAGFAQVAFDELADLAAALADQGQQR